MSVPQAKRETMRLVVTLLITCLVSGGVLAAVYGWMNPLIEARRMERVMSIGLQGVFPDAASFSEVALDELPAGVEAPVYEVFNASGRRLGIWFTGSSNGYGGPIRMAIGVDPDSASLVSVKVLEQSETPGLGDRITQESFLSQLEGKALSDPFKIGTDVQGVSSATVSSRAVFDGASRMARDVLAAMGVEVQVAAAAEPAEATGAPAVAEPAYAGKIRSLLGDDVAIEPAGVWEIREGGTLVAVAAVASQQGFAAPIEVLAIVDPASETLLGLEVLKVVDTPGLGTRVQEPGWLSQFAGKSLSDEFKVGKDIDGITMATISAQATADAAKKAAELVLQLYGK